MIMMVFIDYNTLDVVFNDDHNLLFNSDLGI
jgi:hypothetical protein